MYYNTEYSAVEFDALRSTINQTSLFDGYGNNKYYAIINTYYGKKLSIANRKSSFVDDKQSLNTRHI